MKLIGLGGGIGSGKSTVSLLLAERGAVIVDADVIARQVVEPGTDGLAAIVARFGSNIVDADGRLKRGDLAAIVFSDSDALAALNAITHPAINTEIARQIAAHANTDAVVILDAALLFDRAREGMAGKMVVDVDPEIAIRRLMEFRGFSEADARARIGAQMGRDERRAQADFVIDNSRTRADLEENVDRAWSWISGLPASGTSG